MSTQPHRVAWATDLHLPHASEPAVRAFLSSLRDGSDSLLLTGDTGVAHSVVADLERILDAFAGPVYAVLGNHDFYGGSIERVSHEVSALSERRPELTFLDRSPPIALSPTTALVGHSGWGDARLGNWRDSRVRLNDSNLIRDLKWLSDHERNDRLRHMGQRAADHLSAVLPPALDAFQQVIVATHVPPFAEAAWHEGKPSHPDFLPFFVCAAAGAVLAREAERHPSRELLVVCGHTHGSGSVCVLPNLRVTTGGATYGAPAVQGILSGRDQLHFQPLPPTEYRRRQQHAGDGRPPDAPGLPSRATRGAPG